MRRLTAAILLLAFVYSSVLIAGGKGAFVLNAAFWICHCDDYKVQSLSSVTGEGIKAAAEEAGEICYARPSEGNVCKKKLPLRYISLLIGNSTLLQADARVDLRPILRCLDSSVGGLAAVPTGILADLMRPPQA